MDPPELAARFPALIEFGLEERLLDIIEAYLGVPVGFTTVHLRKDIGGGNQVGTRFWHLDTEDVRVIRMMVYLNDVTLRRRSVRVHLPTGHGLGPWPEGARVAVGG